MPEWLMGADCKSAGYAYASSNLARPIPSQYRKISLCPFPAGEGLGLRGSRECTS